jgi:hypothetical protein
MKKVLMILTLFIAFSVKGYCQSEPQDTIALYQMNKVQLATIYLTEANRVVKKMPQIAFDSSMADVPKSKYLNAKFKSVAKKVASYQNTLLKEYAEVIPYADKKDLIEAILYLKRL